MQLKKRNHMVMLLNVLGLFIKKIRIIEIIVISRRIMIKIELLFVLILKRILIQKLKINKTIYHIYVVYVFNSVNTRFFTLLNVP